MVRHFLIAALRNMAANRLQTAIAIFGLAIGLAAAIIAGLVVRNQFTYDSFLPNHERLYVLGTDALEGGRSWIHIPYSMHDEAAVLKDKLPELDGIARVSLSSGGGRLLSRGAVQSEATILEADPNIFEV